MKRMLVFLPTLLLLPIAFGSVYQLIQRDREYWPENARIIAPVPVTPPPVPELSSEIPDAWDVLDPSPFMEGLLQLIIDGSLTSEQQATLLPLVQRGRQAATQHAQYSTAISTWEYGTVETIMRIIEQLSPTELEMFLAAAANPDAPQLSWTQLADRTRGWIPPHSEKVPAVPGTGDKQGPSGNPDTSPDVNAAQVGEANAATN